MSTTLPLIGRTSELERLRAYLERLNNGEGGIILVGGEAGIGKTTLVSSAVSTVTNEHVIKLVCRCPGLGETPPYGPWREALTELEQRHSYDISSLPAPFGLGTLTIEIYEMALALLRWIRTSQRPLILIVEDLQWSDTASIEMLRHLCGRLDHIPMLVIGIYRSEEIHFFPELQRVISDMLRTGAHRILLGEWSKDDVQALILQMFPDAEAPEKLAEEIYRQTSGLPLFVVELLEEIRGNSTGRVPVAKTLQQAIDRKLNALDASHMETLEVAAQIGEQFALALLQIAAGASEEATIQALQQAVNLGVIWRVDEMEDTFQFRHAIVRSVLADRMIGAHRQRCHRLIAEAMEIYSPNALVAIGYHYRQARDERAIPFYTSVGDAALKVGALVDAEQYYRQALSQCREADHRSAELLLKLGFAVRRKPDSEAVDLWTRGLRLAVQSTDEPLEVWFRHLLTETKYNRNEGLTITEVEALAALQERLLDHPRYQNLEQKLFGNRYEYPRIQFIHWNFLFVHGKLEEAQALVDRLTKSFEVNHAQLLQIQSRISTFKGDFSTATAMVRQSSQAAYLRGDYFAAVVQFTNYFYHTYLYKADHPDEIDAIVAELWRLESEAKSKSSYGYLPHHYSASGFYHYTRGEWELARHHLIDYVLHDPDPEQLMVSLAAIMLVETGDLTHLDTVLAKLLPLHPSDPPPASTTVIFWVHAVRASAHLLRGERALALAWLTAADSNPLNQVSKLHRPLVDIAWTDYHRAQGQLDEAFITCSRALEWAESVPIQWFAIKARRRLGEILAERGNVQAGVSEIETARKLAAKCQIPYEEAMCALFTGIILTQLRPQDAVASSPAADLKKGLNDLEHAKEIFTRLGARELADVERQLRMRIPEQGKSVAEEGATKYRLPFADALRQFDQLTQREREVARWVARGLTDKEVAVKLYVSPRTVDNHLRSIYRKLDVRNRAELATLLSNTHSLFPHEEEE